MPNLYYDHFNKIVEDLFGSEPDCLPSVHQNALKSDEGTVTLDESFVRLGDTYVHMKKYGFAMECYREALKLNNGNAMAFNRILLIPPHWISVRASSGKEYTQHMNMPKLVLNDTFRQTLVGGYIVLSKCVLKLSKTKIGALIWAVQNLNIEYFKRRGGPLRDHGMVVLDKAPFMWMINHCHYFENGRADQFPVLILLTREEYKKLRLVVCSSHS